jgi:hypothetical protein
MELSGTERRDFVLEPPAEVTLFAKKFFAFWIPTTDPAANRSFWRP